MLKGKQVYLRTVEMEDVPLLLQWENDPENWKVSGIDVPYTEDEMKQFVINHLPIQVTGQARFIICLLENDLPIGTIDLFDANFKHRFAGVGILIAEKHMRNKGFATESLHLLIQFCEERLSLKNLHCSIHSDNLSSITLFEKAGFTKVGIRKDWYLHNDQTIDEYLFQLCLKK